MASKTADNLVEICPLCSESIAIYAIGKCDHQICYKCSTRMRVLCEQRYCAICRTDLPKVIFCNKSRRFDSIRTRGYPCYYRHQIYFETESMQAEFWKLQEHNCNVCCATGSGSIPFKSFKALRGHMKKDHNLFYCDLCVEHLKVFSFERKAYTRQKLGEHRRIGDVNDRSQSHRGHPMCEFCQERYLDSDELVRHLRKQHYICHFCESDGISNQFYDEYADLREHFQQHHYLCEEGECIDLEFTNAFRSEIDLKAHTSQMHGRSMSKAAARQTRTIDINIQYSDSHSGRRLDHRGYRDGGQRERRPGFSRGRGRREQEKEREEEENAKVVSAVLNTDIARQGNVNVVDKALIQGSLAAASSESEESKTAFEERTADFPTLDGRLNDRSSDEEEKSGEGCPKQPQDTLAKKLARVNKFSVQDGDMEDADFPSLRGEPGKSNQLPANHSWNFNAAVKDFPSLGAGAKKETTHLGRWAASSPQPGLPASGPSSVHTLRDFPSLSSIGGSLVKPVAPKVQSHSAPTQGKLIKGTRQTSVPASGSPQAKKKEWIEGCDVSDRTTEVLLKNSVQGPEAKVRTITRVPDAAPPVPYSDSKKLTMADFPSLHGNGTANKKPLATPAPSAAWRPKKEEPKKEPEREEKPADHRFLKMKTKDRKKKWKGAATAAGQDTDWDCAPTVDGEDIDAGSQRGSPGAKIQLQAEAMEVSVETTQAAKAVAKTSQPAKDDAASKDKKQKTSKQKKKDVMKTVQREKGDGNVEKKFTKKDADRTLKVEKETSPLLSKKSKPKELRERMPCKVETDTCNSNISVLKDYTGDSCLSVPDGGFAVPASSAASDKGMGAVHPLKAFQDNSNRLGICPNAAVPDMEAADWPAVTAAHNKPPLPPPGFTAGAAKPPPGFSSHQMVNAKAPPPGFASVSASVSQESTSIVSNLENIAPGSNGVVASHKYIQPSDFDQRNSQLIRDICTLLDNDDEKFLQFKQSSGQFRQDQIDAAEYQLKCTEVLGKDNFEKIFPELLVLLPDIEKQQQLLMAHVEAKKASENRAVKINKSKRVGWSTGHTDRFSVCGVCRQVLGADDRSAHQREHTSEEDYPSLGSSAAPGIVGMGHRWPRK